MIQRKQTLFLLAALILNIICLCLPLGHFVADGNINSTSTMFNLWITMPNGSHNYSVWALFATLLITCPISLIAIFYVSQQNCTRSVLYIQHIINLRMVCSLRCVCNKFNGIYRTLQNFLYINTSTYSCYFIFNGKKSYTRR